MKSEKMWKELARYYDLLYSWKSYKKEADVIHGLIQKHKKTSGSELLDVACGTGNHIQFLKKHYKITGTDLNKDMLKVARKKFPKLKFKQANMISFDLKKQFDVVICLFSSIGYVKTPANLKKTIACFSKHLKTGGVLIIEPFFTRETYRVGIPRANFVDQPDIKICRMNVSQKRGDIAVFDFYFLVATKTGINFLRDKHELGLFNINQSLAILKENGFKARFFKNGLMRGRGLYLAVKK